MLRITSILCPIDFSAHSEVALPIACSLARDYGAGLVLVYVRPISMPTEFGAIIPDAPEPVEPLKARLRQCVPASFTGSVEICVRDGFAAEEILSTARNRHCDMIVMGTHGRSGLDRLLIGSVAEEVLRSSPCPVMTIKPSKDKPTEPSTDQRNAVPNMDSNEFATVCTADNAVDAEVIRAALNAEGIRCFIEGPNQAGLPGTLGIPVKINVRAADFDRADKLMRNHDAHCH